MLERVAETFLAICPDFPIPKVIILPLVLSNLSQTSLNSEDIVFDRFSSPLDSILIVFLADFR